VILTGVVKYCADMMPSFQIAARLYIEVRIVEKRIDAEVIFGEHPSG
jgi:hypothetical protein